MILRIQHKKRKRFNSKGMSLIELLVVMVIGGILVGGIYRLFVAQGKAYAVQDQVAEVQQNIRGAMEILLRDLRMAGFDDDRTSDIVIATPVIPGDQSITVRYEKDHTLYEVGYRVDGVGGTSSLVRQETTNGGASTTEGLLDNVDALNFTYGVDYGSDGNEDGAVDYWANSAASIQNKKVVAVRASLTARPVQVNPDLKSVSPRTLVSTVTFRNLSLMR